MGTFNFNKGEIGETIVTNCQSYLEEEFVFDEAKIFIDKTNKQIKNIFNNYEEFYNDPPFFLKEDIGYYDGFSISIDFKKFLYEEFFPDENGKYNLENIFKSYMMTYRDSESDENVYNLKNNCQYDYEADKWYTYDGEKELNYNEYQQKWENHLKEFETIVSDSYNFLNYKLLEFGKEADFLNLKENGWVSKKEAIEKEDIDEYKEKIQNKELFNIKSKEKIKDMEVEL